MIPIYIKTFWYVQKDTSDISIFSCLIESTWKMHESPVKKPDWHFVKIQLLLAYSILQEFWIFMNTFEQAPKNMMKRSITSTTSLLLVITTDMGYKKNLPLLLVLRTNHSLLKTYILIWPYKTCQDPDLRYLNYHLESNKI